MITGITFKNFKCFGIKTYFEIKPITLIYGKNSAGKSTILQLIKLLDLSLSENKNFEVDSLLTFSDESSQFDLGSFSDIIYQHNTKLDLEIIFHLQFMQEDQINVYEYQITIGLEDYSGFFSHNNLKKSFPTLKKTKIYKITESTKNLLIETKFIKSLMKKMHKIQNINLNREFIKKVWNFLLSDNDMNPVLFNGKKVDLTNMQSKIIKNIYDLSMKKDLKNNPGNYLKRSELAKVIPYSVNLSNEIKAINRAFQRSPYVRRGFTNIQFNHSERYLENEPIIWNIDYENVHIEGFDRTSEHPNNRNLDMLLQDLKRMKNFQKNKTEKKVRSRINFYYDSFRSIGEGLTDFKNVDLFIGFLKKLKTIKTISNQTKLIENFFLQIEKNKIWFNKGLIIGRDDSQFNDETSRREKFFKVDDFFERELDIYKEWEKQFNYSIYSRINSEISHFLGNLKYLSPHSKAIDRYRFANQKINKNDISKLLIENPLLMQDINKFFKDHEIHYQIIIQEYKLNKKDNDLYEIKLKDLITKTDVHISDTGYGISQFISFVVILFMNEGGLLLKQEVESNLHPTWQIKIAEVLAVQLERNQNNKKKRKRTKIEKIENILYDFKTEIPWLTKCILETHSEHIVLKLKQLVKLKKIDPNDLAIYYVYKDQKLGSSVLQRIRINDKGRFIDKWKDEFFPERFNLI